MIAIVSLMILASQSGGCDGRPSRPALPSIASPDVIETPMSTLLSADGRIEFDPGREEGCDIFVMNEVWSDVRRLTGSQAGRPQAESAADQSSRLY